MDCIASAVLMRPRRPPNPSGPTEVRVASVRAPVADDAETAAAGRDRYDAFCREFGLLAASKENAPVFQRIDLPAWEVEEDSDEKVPFHAVVAGPGAPCLCNLIFLLRSRRPMGCPGPTVCLVPPTACTSWLGANICAPFLGGGKSTFVDSILSLAGWKLRGRSEPDYADVLPRGADTKLPFPLHISHSPDAFTARSRPLPRAPPTHTHSHARPARARQVTAVFETEGALSGMILDALAAWEAELKDFCDFPPDEGQLLAELPARLWAALRLWLAAGERGCATLSGRSLWRDLRLEPPPPGSAALSADSLVAFLHDEEFSSSREELASRIAAGLLEGGGAGGEAVQLQSEPTAEGLAQVAACLRGAQPATSRGPLSGPGGARPALGLRPAARARAQGSRRTLATWHGPTWCSAARPTPWQSCRSTCAPPPRLCSSTPVRGSPFPTTSCTAERRRARLSLPSRAAASCEQRR